MVHRPQRPAHPAVVLLLWCQLAVSWCDDHGPSCEIGLAAQRQRRLAEASSATANVQQHQLQPTVRINNLHRCYGIRGSHCAGYYTQQYVSLNPPKIHSKACLNSCSGRGVCNGETGLCDCPAGMQSMPACVA